MIDYNIISTGSKGNAVVLNKAILVDAGVPFKALAAHYRELGLVLLTHIHSDHFNKTTLHRLAQERPTLRFGCCEWLVAPLLQCGVDKSQIDVYTPGGCFVYKGFCTIKPERMMHNVPNCGYHIWQGDKATFYATDTNSMTHVEAKDYDLYMLEANYDESEIVERIREKQAVGVFCHEYKVLDNHLSREKADNWLYSQMNPNSRYVYLHQHE